jgi:predicted CXXCH cytochrome family protein
MSCVTSGHVLMAPPSIPGATFVGSITCRDCHDNITKDFPTATHSRLQAEGASAAEMGCESCHGPGSLHNESGGARNTIINPRKSPEACFQCHLEMRGWFNLPHHHPVPEGRVNCGDCHNPHKGPVIKSGGIALAAENETCFQCHSAQRGPHAFEHEALREGCVICHNPHGSVNAKLLTERNANLCLKCHFQAPGQTDAGGIVIGDWLHSTAGFLSRGTCWSAGCHEAVHGSHVSSSLRF